MESNVCRICLKTQNGKKVLSLFETYNHSVIAHKIHSVANVSIQEGDGLPDGICPDCLIHLESALAFKKKCEDSNTLLLTSKYNPLCDDKILLSVKKEAQTIYNDACESFDNFDTDSFVEFTKCEETKLEIENVKTEKPVRTYNKTHETVQCDDCGGAFKSKCKLRVHWKKVHLHEKLTCQLCKRMFKSYPAYNRHKRESSRACVAVSKCHVEGIGKTRIFHCPKCSYKTKRAKDIDTHLVTHFGERRFKCDMCTKVFTQQSSMQAHKESFHKEYMIETTCQFCGKHIKGRNRLYRHIRCHTDKSVQCDICKKSLRSARYLKIHMYRHSGVKRFSCDKCPSTFYTSAEMSNHTARVHIKKPYECDICGYVLKTSPRRKKHKAQHTSTNKVCLICGRFFENSEYLAVHQKRHFETNYPCPLCDRSFHSSKARSSHVLGKHKSTVSQAVEKAKQKIIVKQKYQGIGQFEEVKTLSPDRSD